MQAAAAAAGAVCTQLRRRPQMNLGMLLVMRLPARTAAAAAVTPAASQPLTDQVLLVLLLRLLLLPLLLLQLRAGQLRLHLLLQQRTCLRACRNSFCCAVHAVWLEQHEQRYIIFEIVLAVAQLPY
jgi:hypothetical protein